MISTPELNERGNFQVAKCLVVHDDNLEDVDRVSDLLIQIKTELDKQLMLVGESGKARLVSALNDAASNLYLGFEQLMLNGNDLSQIRAAIQAASTIHNRLSKTSFCLLYIIDFTRIEHSMMKLLIHGRNLLRRFEFIKTALMNSPGSTRSILLLDPRNRRIGDRQPLAQSESIMRGNSVFSALVLLVVVVMLMWLKGSGYLDKNRSY
jgi:hypothetical protein